MSQGLFGPFVPHSNDDGQSWADRSFRRTKEEADSKETFGVEARSSQHQNRAPYNPVRY